MREFIETINSGIQPLQNTPVVARVGSDEARKQWTNHFIRKGLVALEQLARENNSENLLFDFSQQVSLAEIFLVPQLYNAQRYNIDILVYARISRVYEYCLKEIPEFENTKPKINTETNSR